MLLTFMELTDREKILQTYDIYKHCMYMPTEEAFRKKIGLYLRDHAVRIYGCSDHDRITGILVVSLAENDRAEIIGISVDPAYRNQGIGSYMINQVQKNLGITFFYAETDDDAVRFYRKNGFVIIAFSEIHDGETVTRYRCELRHTQCN